MELDWFYTGVLKVSHLCYMKGFCELLSWVSTKALVGMRSLNINTQGNRVAIVSSIITKIFLTLCNAGWSHFNLSNKDTRDLFMLCIVLVCQLNCVLFYYCCSIYFVVVQLFILLLFESVSFDSFV
jgi:hypothetical protein